MQNSLLLNILALGTALLVCIEVIVSIRERHKIYTLKDTLYNLYLMLLNAGLALLMLSLTIKILDFFYQFSPVYWSNEVIKWLVLVVTLDLIYYLLHYVDHKVRIFWAVHVTHHNSELFNLTTGVRSSVFQPLYRFVYFIPLALAGFSSLEILFVHTVCQTWGVLVHTRYIDKLPGWIEYVFVTPSHHRVHHACNQIYIDKNMGMFLIIWDRLFKTFQEEMPEEHIRFGITKQPARFNPVTVWNHEWKDMWKDIKTADRRRDKFRYLIKPPGWRHDGSTLIDNGLREL